MRARLFLAHLARWGLLGIVLLRARSAAAISIKRSRKKFASTRPVIIIGSKGEYLGSVEASDRERAEAVAIKQFDSLER